MSHAMKSEPSTAEVMGYKTSKQGRIALAVLAVVVVSVALISALNSSTPAAPEGSNLRSAWTAPGVVTPDLDRVLHFGGHIDSNTRPFWAGPAVIVRYRYWGNVSSPGAPADQFTVTVVGASEETVVDTVRANGSGQAILAPGSLPGHGSKVYLSVQASGHWVLTVSTNGTSHGIGAGERQHHHRHG